MVAGLELCPGDHCEWLKVRLGACWLQSQRFETLLDEVRGPGKTFGAIAPAFHSGRGQSLNVIKVAAGIRWAGADEQQRQKRHCHCKAQPGNESGLHDGESECTSFAARFATVQVNSGQ